MREEMGATSVTEKAFKLTNNRHFIKDSNCLTGHGDVLGIFTLPFNIERV